MYSPVPQRDAGLVLPCKANAILALVTLNSLMGQTQQTAQNSSKLLFCSNWLLCTTVADSIHWLGELRKLLTRVLNRAVVA